MMGLKENIVDIPYDIITSVKIGKISCHLQLGPKLRVSQFY
jgi:hypothetical protein